MNEGPLDRRDALALLWGGLLGTFPLPAWGADAAAPLDDHAKAINRAAATPEERERVVKDPSISDERGARGASAPGRAAGHGDGKGK